MIDKAPQSAAPSRRVPSPLVPAAAALVAGIAAARGYLYFPFSVSLLFAACLAALLLIMRKPLKAFAWPMALFLTGFAAFYLYGPGAPSSLDGLIGRGPVSVTGEVVRPPQDRDTHTLVYIRPESLPGTAMRLPPARPGLVRLSVRGTGLGIEYGDVLTGKLDLRPPTGFKNPGTFNWGDYAALNGIDAVAYTAPEDLYKSGNRASGFFRRLYGFRERLIKLSAESLGPEEAAIFRAMILGDQGAVTQRMRDVFAASGTTHILSVSGSHVALLASLVFFMVRSAFFMLPHGWALRLSMRVDPKKAAAAAAIPAAAWYCLITGSEVATVRSVIMITVFLVSILIERERELLNTLGAAAIIVLLWAPSSLFDISFQLSYGSVLFMALAVREFQSFHDGREDGGTVSLLKRRLAGAAVISIAAILATAPLVAGQFNSFSYVSLPANLAMLPVAGFAVVPAGLLSCLLQGVFGSGALPLGRLDGAVIEAFYAVVRFFASAPHANLHPPAPGMGLAVFYYIAIAAALLWKTTLTKKAAALAVCLAVYAALGWMPSGNGGRLRVSFLDVSNGECSLVEFPDGRRMLIDGGGSPRGIDPGRASVAPYLWNRGIRRLDYAVLTHPHPDHMCGLVYVLDNVGAGQFWEGGLVGDDELYGAVRAAARRCGAARHVLSERGELDIGGAKLQVLGTASSDIDDEFKDHSARENNRSLVLRLSYGDISFLLTGDAEWEAQASMLMAVPPLPLGSTVLKVPHHGSRDSLNPVFLDAVRPEYAVISVGRFNPYGHPSAEVIEALGRIGSKLYRTDEDGAVTFETDGKGLDARTYLDAALAPAGDIGAEINNWSRLMAR